MRLIFISRKYPPSVGGMERVNYRLSKEFEKNIPTYIIAWGRSQAGLPYFLIKAFIVGLWQSFNFKSTNIHLGDGVLAPLGLILKILTRRKVSITIHGLDITYKSKFYQWLIPRCVSKLDKVICISRATMTECIKRGISQNKCTVIGWGVDVKEWQVKATRKDLEKIVGSSLKNKKILVTVGRLVPRKGVHWFIESVMPKLGSEYIYLVVGEGSDKSKIESAVIKNNLTSKVFLLGRASDEDVKIIYNTADVFVMPNIPSKGDMEGFGTVALEAAAAGLPIVASNLEGIADAVLNEKTGKLVKAKNSNSFAVALKKIHFSKRSIKKNLELNFSWSHVLNKYRTAL